MHIAAESGSRNCISVLLANGSDPSLKTVDSIPAFRFCQNREIRSAFWEFRESNPARYNWDKSEIPDPAQIKENPSGRKRPKRKKKKEEKENGTVEPLKVQNPCEECGIEIVEIPFKYSDFKFCTTRCLRAHRFTNLNK